MRVILSRKGFDSASGGMPSPILPDGTLLSLPIPESAAHPGGATPYRTIPAPGGRDLARTLRMLGAGSAVIARGAHLDPDIDPDARPRLPGWRPAFGQSGAAAAHLDAMGVAPGDLFLFFGLFRETVIATDGRLRWKPGSRPRHVIWGWLQVGEVRRIEPGAEQPPWSREHAHVRDPARPRNTLYVAAAALSLDPALPGAGRFRHDPSVVLSRPGAPPSTWSVPAALRSSGLSYHGDPERWSSDSDGSVTLRSVARGQEFVAEATPETLAWVRGLLRSAARDRAVLPEREGVA